MFKTAAALVALAFRQALGDPPDITPQPRIAAQARLKVTEERIEERLQFRFRSVIDPFPHLARPDETRLANDLEMRGKRGLADFQRVAQLADTKLTPAQSDENANPRGVGQRFGGRDCFSHAGNHIVICRCDKEIPITLFHGQPEERKRA